MTAKQAAALADRLAKLAKADPVAAAEVEAGIEAAEVEANKSDTDRLAEANAKIADMDTTIGTMLDNLTEADATIAKLRTAKNAKGGIEAVFNLPDLKASTSTYGNEMRRGEIVANGLTYRLTVSRYDASKPKPQRR